MLCMASCCSGITVICTAMRFQAAPLLAPGFTPALSTPSLPGYLHILAALFPCHAEGERSWSGSRAGCVLARVSVAKLGLTQCQWLIVRHLALWRHPQMLSQPLHHVMELMQSLHCLSQLPQRKEKSKSDISECAAILHNCESNLGNSHLQ